MPFRRPGKRQRRAPRRRSRSEPLEARRRPSIVEQELRPAESARRSAGCQSRSPWRFGRARPRPRRSVSSARTGDDGGIGPGAPTSHSHRHNPRRTRFPSRPKTVRRTRPARHAKTHGRPAHQVGVGPYSKRPVPEGREQQEAARVARCGTRDLELAQHLAVVRSPRRQALRWCCCGSLWTASTAGGTRHRAVRQRQSGLSGRDHIIAQDVNDGRVAGLAGRRSPSEPGTTKNPMSYTCRRGYARTERVRRDDLGHDRGGARRASIWPRPRRQATDRSRGLPRTPPRPDRRNTCLARQSRSVPSAHPSIQRRPAPGPPGDSAALKVLCIEDARRNSLRKKVATTARAVTA